MADARPTKELTPLQNAVYLLKQTQAELAECRRGHREPIAVVGMGCRFPGSAENPAEYWKLLRNGVDAIGEIPPERWDVDAYYDPDPGAPGKMSTRWGGFLKTATEFDADFFGISPREAVRVDPQHRLLLEVTWEALEDAGLPAEKIAHTKTGVYVGVIGNDYALIQARDYDDLDVFSGTGSSHAVLANRLSYVLNLNGPSIALDTACSSSLVTLHLACQSLRRRESDMAIAGGVNLILSPEMTITLTKAHMMSADGRCKAFDARADGYVRGEGCGMVVLKRLSDAQADGDRILAVVRGTAVNHDGRSNGLSAPNGPAQELVIREALRDAGLTADQISYVEAHGTGTRLGDPIEMEALRAVLGTGRPQDHPLLVGSLKTNIGHLESAAGIASVIKIIQMLRNRQIPPHLHLETVNPLVQLDKAPIEIPTDLRAWPDDGQPRRAGVSSFGFGGTNGHVILEEAPIDEPVDKSGDRPLHIMTLSARSSQALSDIATRYVEHLRSDTPVSVSDLAFTANTGRTHFAHRAAVVAKSKEQLRDKLASIDSDSPAIGVHGGAVEQNRQPRIAFLFTGQGAQYAGMGRDLYETEATFREAIDECSEHLNPHLDRPLLSLLDSQAGAALDQTGYTQPVMFSLEYALAALWRSWGVEPAVVMGHSVGEFAAACVAGVFTLPDGLRLIAERARLMQALPSGGLMAAVLASEEQIAPAIEEHADRVAIAAFNGPQNTVISGEETCVRDLLSRFEAKGIKSQTLATSHAFHSHLMDPILSPLERFADSIPCSAPQIKIIANLTGQPADKLTYAAPSYWSQHARRPVQFVGGMQTLAAQGCDVFLEVGPHPTLIGMGRRCLTEDGLAWLPSLRAKRDDWQTLLNSVAKLYVHGARIDWTRFDRHYHRRRVELPTYPFQRRHFWSGAAVGSAEPRLSAALSSDAAPHPLLGSRLVAAISDTVFEAQVSQSRPATLSDHKVQGVVVMPGAAYMEMAMAAAAKLHDEPWNVCGVSLLEPLTLDSKPKWVQTIVTPDGPTTASFRIVSITAGDSESEPSFTTHAAGHLEASAEEPPPPVDLEQARARFKGEPYDDAWRSETLRKSGLEPGPTFCWISAHWLDDEATFADIRSARDNDHADQYQVHPGLLDCGFQLLGASLPGAETGIDAYVPMGVDRIRLFGRAADTMHCLTTLKSLEGNLATGDIRLVDDTGRLLMEVQGVRLRRVPRDWLARMVAEPTPQWLHELAWVPQSLDETDAEETSIEAGRWLILDAQDGLGTALAERLQTKGHRCQVAASTGDVAARLAALETFLSAGELPCRGVVYLTGLNVDSSQEETAPDFDAARRDGWGGVLDTLHSLTTSGLATPPRLWLVSRGAQTVSDHPRPVALGQSPIWGLGRVIAAEHPELACTRVDLDPEGDRGNVDQLADEIWSGQQEDQVAFRGGERFITRLRKLQREGGSLDVPYGQPYRLEITTRGALDNVTLRPVTRQQPGPGQVEIKVRATGLNFRDVLNVLDLYPGDPGPLGGECAGEIVAVGEGVEDLKPGDSVVALAPASFASHVVTLAEFVVRRPEVLSFEEAATIPICFATVQHSLCRLGSMQAGERVLIHAASGGVGMAAIQIAKRIGAEIFATAGSPRKREYLKSLGIEHVMDSRSVDFADQIMEITGGEGVDLVLNSLTGESIGKSLSVLREGGRFLELGKTDLWDQKRVDAFRPGVTFYAIALDQMMAEEPELVQHLMQEVMNQFADGTLVPPPLRTFAIERAVEAMRHMARAEHIGKIVIEAAHDHGADERPFWLNEEGTYLVTGGLGGLGLKTACWLADHGARNLVLVGRSGPSDEAQGVIEDLEQAGVHVEARQCDVSQRDDVARLLSGIREDLPPLQGVFHLAGVLDDGILREQTRERFDRVMAAKAKGAWYLHELTSDDPLDLFVLFSSAASMLGSPGQGNYASANAFLDALAHYRRRIEKPALSINWGSWAEVGMAARLGDSESKRWSAAGVGWIDPDRGLQTLERLIVEGHEQAGVLPMNWPKFFQRIPVGGEPPWLSEMAAEARAAGDSGDSGPPVLLEKLEEVTAGERIEAALTYLQKQAGRVLAMADGDLPDPRRPLNELGFDSLTAVEFCNRVGRSIGKHINPTVLFDYPTLDSLTGYVVRDVLKLETAGDAPQEEPKPEEADDTIREQALNEVEGMSEEEMDALVEQQLEDL